MEFQKMTPFETEVMRSRMGNSEDQDDYLDPVTVHRHTVVTQGDEAIIHTETNDDNDDGYPDGHWESWTLSYPSVEQALKHTGKCRVGVSGVIVTVTLDGEEVR